MKKYILFIAGILCLYGSKAQKTTNSMYHTSEIDGATRTLNTYYEVGTIPGSIDVSPNGVAMYVVPIDVAPGKNGMEPSISIGYNSNALGGDLGWKWNLNANSVIARGTTSSLQEGYVDGGDYSDNDKFYLDGNRLILHSGTYGKHNSEYRTESESFSRVKQVGSGNTAYFKVWTKDGKILYYGNDAGSRFNGTSGVLVWALTKIQDYEGNAIVYHYINNGTDFRLESITYAGNSINLIYGETGDTRVIYQMGQKFTNSTLLKSIEVKAQEKVIWTYEFYYTKNMHSKLNEIVFKTADNKQYNTTLINWGKAVSFNETSDLTQPQNGAKYADLNGDGRTDYVNASWNLLTVNIANTGNFEFTELRKTTSSLGANKVEIHIYDHEKDQFDDLFACYRINEGRGYRYHYIIYSIENGNIIEKTSGNYNSPKNDLSLRPADLDGNKDMEIIVSNNTNGILDILGLSYTGSVLPTTCYNPRMLIEDIDLDGKDEIIYLNHDLKVYTFKPAGKTFEVLVQSSLFDRETNFNFADFNGDGYLDFLTYKYHKKVGTNHSIKLFTGTGLVEGNCPFQDRDDSTPFANYQVYYPGDFNGDGISDILDVYFDTQWNSTLGIYVYIPSIYMHYGGTQNFTTKNASTLFDLLPNGNTALTYEIKIMDRNGDAISDIFYNLSTSLHNWHLLYSNMEDPLNRVTAITNGMNIRNEITYAYLNKSDHYSASYLEDETLKRATKNLLVATDIKTYHESTLLDSINYHYENATWNKYVGFVGFSGFKISNAIQNKYYRMYKDFVGEYAIPTVSVQQSLINTTDIVTHEIHYKSFEKNIKPGGFTWHFKPTKTVSVNHLTSVTTTREYLNYDAYMNPIDIKTTYGSDWVSNSHFMYSNYVNSSYWLIDRKILETVTNDNTYEAAKSISTNYRYSQTHPHRLEEIIEFYQTNMERKTRLAYNSGLITGQTISSGNQSRTETYEYDPTGRFLEKITNGLGHSKYAIHDTYTGTILHSQDENGLKTQYQYDSFGKLIKTISPNNTETTGLFRFTNEITGALYKKVTLTSGLPDITAYYNCLGQEVQTQTINNERQTVKTQTTYYENHKIRTQSLPYTSVKKDNRYTYDAYGRLKTQVLANGSGTVSYDYNGLTTKISTPEGWKETRLDDAGFLELTRTDGGWVLHKYYSSGLIKTTTAANKTVAYNYDIQGNVISVSDPDIGTHTHLYNGLGELTHSKGPNNFEFDLSYDAIGRLKSRDLKNGNELTEWFYDPKGNIGAVNKITVNRRTVEQYEYDTYGQITKSVQNILHNNQTKSYIYNFEYDNIGRLTKLVYPKGYELNYNYDSYSFLTSVYDNKGFFNWSNPTYNDLGMHETFELGNGLDAGFTYDSRFMPDKRYYGTKVKHDYGFSSKGNLMNRKDVTRSVNNEDFVYDVNNRLTVATIGPDVTYGINTNINTKEGIGTYGFRSSSSHALQHIDASSSRYNPAIQDINYNHFGKIENITSTLYRTTKTANFTYGVTGNRTVMEVKKNGAAYYTKYYAGEMYEEKEDAGGNTTGYNYIYVEGQMLGMYTDQPRGNDVGYYIHTDYLGSVIALSDERGSLIEEYAYDAWGKRVNPVNWNLDDTRSSFICDRGFTGHEQLDDFQLINMNGRVYDPSAGMFLSPDPIIQDPENPLNYNRYSYVLNNPLKYTDPSGYQTAPAYMAYDWEGGSGSGGGGGGSVFPKMGTLDSPKNNFEYDLQYEANVDRALGLSGGASGVYATLLFAERGVYGKIPQAKARAIMQGKAYYWHRSTGKDAKHIIVNGQKSGPGVLVAERKVYFENLLKSRNYGPEWISYIPVIGSARDAIRDFQNGNYGWAAFNAVMAVTDVFLVKSLFVSGGKMLLKGGVKWSGSHTWNATKSHWKRMGIDALNGGSKHHWAVSQKTAKKYGMENFVNQSWNIIKFETHPLHMARAHGVTYKGLKGSNTLGQLWYGTPTWFKTSVNYGINSIENGFR